MVMIRVSSVFIVVVMATKMTLFVMDDSKFIEVEKLAALEKRIGQLIDEALRHREEEAEREEEAAKLSVAHHFIAIKRAIVRRLPGRFSPGGGPRTPDSPKASWIDRFEPVSRAVSAAVHQVLRGLPKWNSNDTYPYGYPMQESLVVVLA